MWKRRQSDHSRVAGVRFVARSTTFTTSRRARDSRVDTRWHLETQRPRKFGLHNLKWSVAWISICGSLPTRLDKLASRYLTCLGRGWYVAVLIRFFRFGPQAPALVAAPPVKALISTHYRDPCFESASLRLHSGIRRSPEPHGSSRCASPGCHRPGFRYNRPERKGKAPKLRCCSGRSGDWGAKKKGVDIDLDEDSGSGAQAPVVAVR